MLLLTFFWLLGGGCGGGEGIEVENEREGEYCELGEEREGG